MKRILLICSSASIVLLSGCMGPLFQRHEEPEQQEEVTHASESMQSEPAAQEHDK